MFEFLHAMASTRQRKAPPPPSPRFEFRSPAALRPEVIRLASGLAESARAQIARAVSDPNGAIHETRLILKRFRALLRLLQHTLNPRLLRAENERLRRASQRLANARDTLVGLNTLGTLGRELHGSDAAAVKRVRRRLAESISLPAADAATVSRQLRAALGAAQRAADALSRARWREQGWAAIEPSLRRGYRRVRRRYKAAHTDGGDETFHRWRTAAKAFMYQLQLLRPAAPKRIEALLVDWNELQKRLGDEHDLAVLRERLEAGATRSTRASAEGTTLRAINHRQQRLRKAVLKLGRRLLAHRSSEFTRRLHHDWKRWAKRR